MAIEIRNASLDDETPNRWWFQLVGQHSSDSTIRLARVDMVLSANETPQDWLAANLAAAQILLDAGDVNEVVTNRWNFADLKQKAINELAYLDTTIPQIDTMTSVQVRDVVKRLAQENRQIIKAFRYLFDRLDG